tara:strand:+ start:113 stop:1309 length:1197 start_codon:yes stop_codon:yes gene_type:complete
MNIDEELVIAIIGAGGIGSNLVSMLYPALQQGDLVNTIGDIRICIYDSDTVEKKNLPHQNFNISDIGGLKVTTLCNRLWYDSDKSINDGPNLTLEPCPWDIRSIADLLPCDIVVVAVDSHQARKVVHENCKNWLDLRCLGDGYIALDDSVKADLISDFTPEQDSQSCQFDGAIESGNIQFGFMVAASHGAQWLIQSLRIQSGDEMAQRPFPQVSSISFGTATRLAQSEESDLDIVGGVITPMIHSDSDVMREVSNGNHHSILIKETLAGLAEKEDWPSLWALADDLGREVSILYDNNSSIWVDIGTSGRVELAPPVGSEIPYKLWIHTHPRDAYWSLTDKETISIYSDILDKAIVLGHDHYKKTIKINDNFTETLAESGRLSIWTDEPIRNYDCREEV